MTYTFDQMMKGEDLPEDNHRCCVQVQHGTVPNVMKERQRERALAVYEERHGKKADTLLAAEDGGRFVCMAYRIAP